MNSLPPKPKGNLPSLSRAQRAHSHLHSRINKNSSQSRASKQAADGYSRTTLRCDRNMDTFPSIGARGETISYSIPGVSNDLALPTIAAIWVPDRTGEVASPCYDTRKRKTREGADCEGVRPALKKAKISGATLDVAAAKSTRGIVAHGQAKSTGKRYVSYNVVEEGEIVEDEDSSVADDALSVRKRKRNKHKPHKQRRAKSKLALEMRQVDLIPHHQSTVAMFTYPKEKSLAKQIVRKPTTFMDLNEDCRRIIWGKVFEDEAYRFKVLRYCSRDSWKHMRATVPPSFGCLLINKQFGAEAAQEMYKSVRLELEFGKLRPKPLSEFMNRLGHSVFGEQFERIFFVNKFSFQRVNLGRFKKAKEIISEHWTIDGDRKMDDDDFKNNRIDPLHVLQAPDESQLKGFKQRKAYTDHKKAFDRYRAHLEGRCNPLMKDLNAEDFDEAMDRKTCCWDEACTNLEKTVFAVVLKYKFGYVKGRHARHKFVMYDYYPPQRGQPERLVQSSPFTSNFHKKIPKKSKSATEGDDNCAGIVGGDEEEQE